MHLFDIKACKIPSDIISSDIPFLPVVLLLVLSLANRVQRLGGHLAKETLVRVDKAGAVGAEVLAELASCVRHMVVKDDEVAEPLAG